jgi:hypothetical protein
MKGIVVIFHRTVLLALFAASSAMVCSRALAQEAQTVTVAAGTEARLVMVDNMSSQTAFTGQKFKLALDQDIRVAGRVAIPHGTQAFGTVVNARKSGSVGESGQLNLRIDYLLIDGRRIPLFTSSVGKLAKEHQFGSVMLIAFFGPMGMLKKGESVNFPPGTQVLAYIDATTPITLPAAAPSVAPAAPAASESTLSQSSK